MCYTFWLQLYVIFINDTVKEICISGAVKYPAMALQSSLHAECGFMHIHALSYCKFIQSPACIVQHNRNMIKRSTTGLNYMALCVDAALCIAVAWIQTKLHSRCFSQWLRLTGGEKGCLFLSSPDLGVSNAHWPSCSCRASAAQGSRLLLAWNVCCSLLQACSAIFILT